MQRMLMCPATKLAAGSMMFEGAFLETVSPVVRTLGSIAGGIALIGAGMAQMLQECPVAPQD